MGGIKEKVLAAKRAGIERVVLPEQNRKDVEEVESGLLEGIELEYVGTIDEALEYTLADTPPDIFAIDFGAPYTCLRTYSPRFK